MKYYASLILLLICTLSLSAQHQETTSSKTPKPTLAPTNEKSDSDPELDEQTKAKARQVISNSGRYFKQGLFHLQDDRRGESREEFDKAVEVFLLSGVNVQRSQEMRKCYSHLVETLYRLEFPANQQQANIRGLSATCGWNIDNKLADDVAKLVITAPGKRAKTAKNATTKPRANMQPDEKVVGFSEQVFEPLPLDELAKLELTPDEIDTLENKNTNYSRPQNYSSVGKKPAQLKDGKIPIVIKYIDNNFNDPYSIKYLEWKISPARYNYKSYRLVTLRLRAKNLYNAYRLTTMYFLISQNKVVYAFDETEAESKRILPAILQQTQEIQVRPKQSKSVRIVRAQNGDTILKIANRYGVNAVELAKFNGLLPDSKLPTGREIKIPEK